MWRFEVTVRHARAASGHNKGPDRFSGLVLPRLASMPRSPKIDDDWQQHWMTDVQNTLLEKVERFRYFGGFGSFVETSRDAVVDIM